MLTMTLTLADWLTVIWFGLLAGFMAASTAHLWLPPAKADR